MGYVLISTYNNVVYVLVESCRAVCFVFMEKERKKIQSIVVERFEIRDGVNDDLNMCRSNKMYFK